MRSEAELTQIAIDAITGKVFMTQNDKDVLAAFNAVFLFMDDKTRQRIAESKPQVFYEYYDRASRSHNGYPVFYSMQWIPEEEMKIFRPIYETKRKALHSDDEQ
jgi:hypothetical protein